MSFLSPHYVDRALPLRPEQMRSVRRRAWTRWRQDRRNILLYVGVLILVNLLANGLIYLPLSGESLAKRMTEPWQWIVAATGFVAILYACVLLLQRRRFAPLLRAEIRALGLEVCTKCGGWIRDSRADHRSCARCGARRQPMPRGLSGPDSSPENDGPDRSPVE